jgi:hypothetical protein
MGNGVILHDKMEAAEALLKREYPEIADDKLARAIFAPDFFVSKFYDVLEYPKEAKGTEASVLGEENEGKMFESLKRHFNELGEVREPMWLQLRLIDCMYVHTYIHMYVCIYV